KLQSTFAMIADITQQKMVEEKLGKREHLLKSIFDTALDAIVTIDEDFVVTKWNQQAEVMFGYAKTEAIGQSLLELIAVKENREMYQEKMLQFLQNGKKEDGKKRIETWLLDKYGVEFPVEFSISPIDDQDGYQFSIFLRDITEQKGAKQALTDKIQELDEKNRELKRYASSNSQLENFAYVASHDLKEPLRTIGNFVQLLEKRLGDKLDATDQEFFQFIVGGVQNMNTLINDLLTYSRVNTQEHSLSEIEMEDALFVILRSLDTKIKETDTQIKIKGMPQKIVANKTKLKQIFQNLIANAIKFRRPDQSCCIEIEGKEDEHFWYFSIKDNGIGIKPEFHQKIFELFKKLHSKSEYQGSGIGLAVCKRIVEQHGGAIWVESTMGEGTCFEFSFAKTCASI
ncbi:MAG: ATP-binding protein, partial [Bacteroidota bacterium]